MVSVQRRANSLKGDKKSEIVVRMQKMLDRLGIPLMISWNPNPNMAVHGEIKGNSLFVYDKELDEAWATFMHEVVEFKLKQVTRVYRTLINNLIEGYEKLAYQEKEEFVEFIPKLIEAQKPKLDGSSIDS